MKSLNKRRLGALIIDVYLFGFIAQITMMLMVYRYHHGLLGIAVCAFLVTYVLCRDSYNGVSIGRKLMKIRVVSEIDGMPLSPWKSVYRNFFLMLLGAVEGIVLLASGKRVGDIVTKATVVPLEGKSPKGRLKGAIIPYTVIFVTLYTIYIAAFLFVGSPFKEEVLTW